MSKPLRLAYIIGTYPSLTTTFIDREIKILRELGVNIQILSIRPSPADIALSKEQQEIKQHVISLLPVQWLALIIANFYFILFHPQRFLGTLIYLLTHLRLGVKAHLKTLFHFEEGVYAAYLLHRQPPMHIHAHFVDRAATVAMIIGRLLNLPYSVTAHANDIYTDAILLCEKLQNTQFAVTVSRFNKSYLLDMCRGLDSGKVHVLHPWIDLGNFTPPANPMHSKKFRILSVGRLVEKKGHEYLVKACHLLQENGIDFECRIIGAGPLKSNLECDIIHYNLQQQVKLLGPQPQKIVFENLEWCDVFVLPCVVARDGDRDGMPVALAEAMAMKTPVVSCKIAGIDELVQTGAGVLVPPRDVATLTEALQIIQNKTPESRIEMGCRGRDIIQSGFNLHTGVQHLKDLFQHSVDSTKTENQGEKI